MSFRCQGLLLTAARLFSNKHPFRFRKGIPQSILRWLGHEGFNDYGARLGPSNSEQTRHESGCGSLLLQRRSSAERQQRALLPCSHYAIILANT